MFFSTGMSILEGKQDITKECRQKLYHTWLAGSLFWLPAQVTNNVLLNDHCINLRYLGLNISPYIISKFCYLSFCRLGSQLPAGPPSGPAVVRQLLLLALGQCAVHFQEKSGCKGITGGPIRGQEICDN